MQLDNNLPELALSVRQPWAWAIIHADKNIENRSAGAMRWLLTAIGQRIAIHAAKGMTCKEYESAREFMERLGFACPDAHALHRGGIVGSVEVYGQCREDPSPWFFGPRGLLLRKPLACPFVPATGQLGLFRWQPSDWSSVPAPKPWMLPKPPKRVQREEPTPDFFKQDPQA